MSKISVIVPVYNTEMYVKDCVESILRQTFCDFQLILVDDGSKDESGKICDKLALLDKRISVYHTENHGLMAAWKYGFTHAKSEYIGFVDSDDWVDSDMYEILYNTAIESEADVVVSDFVINEGDGQTQSKDFSVYDRSRIESDIYSIYFSGANYSKRGLPPNRVTKLFKAELLSRIIELCDDKVSIGEDLVTTFNALLVAKKIAWLRNYKPYHYRMSEGSMIRGYSDKKYDALRLLHDCLKKIDKSQNYSFEKQINTDFIKLMLMQLETEILFSQRSFLQLMYSMNSFWKDLPFQDAIRTSEVQKLPKKYRVYLFLLKMKLYPILWFVRKVKRVG